MDFLFSDLYFNSVENLPDFEARAAFLCKGKALRVNPVNSASVFREGVDIVRLLRKEACYCRFTPADEFECRA